MSKSRRELFEDQLKDLQKDIASLSQKLAVPSLVATNRIALSKGNSLIQDTSFNTTKELQSSTILQPTESSAITVNNDQHQVDYLYLQLKKANDERDDAIRKHEQAKQEIEALKKALLELNKHQSTIDALKQDNEALKISLESSERIRLQQKELISVLQKSHAIMSESSVGSNNSISSISHKADNDSVGPSKFSAQTQSGYRDWLNSSSQPNSSTQVPVVIQEGSQMQGSKVSTQQKKVKKTKKEESFSSHHTTSSPLPPREFQSYQIQTVQSHIDSVQNALRGMQEHSSLSVGSSVGSSQQRYFPDHTGAGYTALGYNNSHGAALNMPHHQNGVHALVHEHPHHHVHFPVDSGSARKPPLYPSGVRSHQPNQYALTPTTTTVPQHNNRGLPHHGERISPFVPSSTALAKRGGSKQPSLQKTSKRETATKKTTGKSKEKRSSSAPPGTRYMYRAAPSPSSTFGKAERWADI